MLKRAYRGLVLTVRGKFEPKNVVGHRVDPQKALPYVTTRVWAIVRQNLSTGHFRRVRDKKIKKKRPYIHVFR